MGCNRMVAYGVIWVENFGRDGMVRKFGGHRPMARRPGRKAALAEAVLIFLFFYLHAIIEVITILTINTARNAFIQITQRVIY